MKSYRYEKFNEDLQEWLMTGRFVVYVYGNFHPKLAINLVDDLRDTFNLKVTEHKNAKSPVSMLAL